MSIFIFCQSPGLLYDTVPGLPSKTSRVGDLYLRGLTASFVLLGIGLQERQEHVGPGCFGRDVVGVGGGSGRSGRSAIGTVAPYWVPK